MSDAERSKAAPGAAPDAADASGEADGRTAASEAVARSVGEVITAAIGVGASVARAAAVATAGAKGVEPAKDDRPLEALVHYSVAAITNVLGAVVAGAGIGPRTSSPSAAPKTRSASATTLPTVHAGHTLRVPLSVENPGSEPMSSVTPSCLRITGGALGSGRPLNERAVSFQPAKLDVAPRDFEKLTVFVETTPDAAPGRYEVVIGLGSPGGETLLKFDVIGAK